MILALCGTVEGAQLLQLLAERQLEVMATVTTDYGAKCLGDNPPARVLERKLSQGDLERLLSTENIEAIIDVTHPYATVISTMAIEASQAYGIPYYRYERKRTTWDGGTQVVEVESFSEAATLCKDIPGKIFLAIGSKHLSIFTAEIEVNRLIARVLPFGEIVKDCETLGFTPDNLIAMKGPFDEGINRWMFQRYQAAAVVTKDSGAAGGTIEKINAAKALGIPVILVGRPKIDYGYTFDSLRNLVDTVVATRNKGLRFR